MTDLVQGQGQLPVSDNLKESDWMENARKLTETIRGVEKPSLELYHQTLPLLKNLMLTTLAHIEMSLPQAEIEKQNQSIREFSPHSQIRLDPQNPLLDVEETLEGAQKDPLQINITDVHEENKAIPEVQRGQEENLDSGKDDEDQLIGQMYNLFGDDDAESLKDEGYAIITPEKTRKFTPEALKVPEGQINLKSAMKVGNSLPGRISDLENLKEKMESNCWTLLDLQNEEKDSNMKGVISRFEKKLQDHEKVLREAGVYNFKKTDKQALLNHHVTLCISEEQKRMEFRRNVRHWCCSILGHLWKETMPGWSIKEMCKLIEEVVDKRSDLKSEGLIEVLKNMPANIFDDRKRHTAQAKLSKEKAYDVIVGLLKSRRDPPLW